MWFADKRVKMNHTTASIIRFICFWAMNIFMRHTPFTRQSHLHDIFYNWSAFILKFESSSPNDYRFNNHDSSLWSAQEKNRKKWQIINTWKRSALFWASLQNWKHSIAIEKLHETKSFAINPNHLQSNELKNNSGIEEEEEKKRHDQNHR